MTQKEIIYSLSSGTGIEWL